MHRVTDIKDGENHAYLCYETWRTGGRARRGHDSRHQGCPGHGIPYPGRVWKRGEVYNPLTQCPFSLSHLTASAVFAFHRFALRPLVCGEFSKCLVQNQALATHPYE